MELAQLTLGDARDVFYTTGLVFVATTNGLHAVRVWNPAVPRVVASVIDMDLNYQGLYMRGPELLYVSSRTTEERGNEWVVFRELEDLPAVKF